MRIALLAPLWKTVPPEKYGGSELVVANLADALVDLGHEVTLFACRGSQTKARLIEVIPDTMYNLCGGFAWDAVQSYEFLAYNLLAQHIHEFDIVHNHLGLHVNAFAPLLPIPIVTTMHSSVKPDFPLLADALNASSYVSISDAQRALAPNLNYVRTIYHGIATESFTPKLEQGKHLLFLGSLTREKGVDRAIKAAKATGQTLVLAGEVRDSDKEWLENEVYPYIDGEQISFVGEVNHVEKNRLLGEAKALVLPVRWQEAFGLVMAEALACGTPVIAWGNGSIPEVVDDGKTGFVVNSDEELQDAILKIDIIDRQHCRSEAERRFSAIAMAQAYVDLFNTLIVKQ